MVVVLWLSSGVTSMLDLSLAANSYNLGSALGTKFTSAAYSVQTFLSTSVTNEIT